MHISNLLQTDVGILGFGREGAAMFETLRAFGHEADVRVFADEPMMLPAGAKGFFGARAAEAVGEVEILIRSPGFSPFHPIRKAVDATGIKQTTSTNLFVAEARAAGLPVIGITGSKGKSTAATLTHRLLQEAGIPSLLAGNIGVPAVDQLTDVLERRLVSVLELSSYQCADLPDAGGPSIACLLDIFPEHLDWHGGLRAYYDAKLRVAESQCPGDTFFYNQSSAGEVAGREISSHKISINDASGFHFKDGWFRHGESQLFSDETMRVPGAHNRRNAVAALAIGAHLKVEDALMKSVLTSYGGLPYRLEDEGVHGGIRWINDNLSTAPEAVEAALEALSPPAHTLIVGGQDRGYAFDGLAVSLEKYGVRVLLLLPDTGEQLHQAMHRQGVELDAIAVDSLKEAVVEAKKRTPPGGTCLFSPGAPSYHRYTSFEERGRAFHESIQDCTYGSGRSR